MSNRATLCSALLIAVAGLWACWCDVAMLWDGAYQFCCSITAGRAFAYLSRFHSWVVWQPAVGLSHITGNLRLLKMAYGAPFCFAPLAGVLLSWWIVRRRAPHLMLWALFGTAMASLPGQIFMINDSIFQMHLFWPVFFATFLPLSRLQRAAMLVLSLFQLSHPIGIGLCALCAVAAAAFARWQPAARRRALAGWALWHAVLAGGGVSKLFIWPDLYAAREASLGQAWMTFRWGVLWWPLAGMLAAWIAAALFLWVRARPDSTAARRAVRAALPLLALTGACWLYWASDPLLWGTAANYRRWLVPMSMPFLLAAGWELWRSESAPADRGSCLVRHRDHAGLAIAAVFSLVLGVQSWEWSGLFHRLSRDIDAWPSTWIKPTDLPWVHETPLDHWGLGAQVLVVQGRTPRVLLWNPGDELAAQEVPPRFALSPFNYFDPAASPQSWFDWSRALRETRESAVAPP